MLSDERDAVLPMECLESFHVSALPSRGKGDGSGQRGHKESGDF